MADEAPLRLASIVGVDVAGYSARTEADSSATARQIVALRTRIAEIAARHHGRIFNTAGDGVMLEFAAASDAVEAIFDLLDERPAREPEAHIGAHLGDVTTTENGDLLGHGVNVAARLMAIAPTGRAVISQDLRAAAGSHAKREMRSLGEVALAKMQAKVFAFEIAPDTGAKLAPVASWRSPRNVLIAGGAIAALAVAAGVFFLMQSPEKAAPFAATEATHTDVATAAPTEQPRVSIAVLPFVNMSSDPEQEYFSDGLSEELMNQLAQIIELRVTARTSSFAFKGKNEDLRVIGEKLGVANVLEGSVRKSGEKLRITAQLIKVDDGSHLWSKTYDRDLNDVFAIQEEIATAVASALSIKLGIGDKFDYGGTKSFEAYDQYLKGMTAPWDEGPEASLKHLRQAVAIDPDYALAWATLAAHLAGAQQDLEPDQREAYEAERAEAMRRALALAPDLPDTLIAEAFSQALKLNWAAAEEAVSRARARAGSDPVAWAYIGEYLSITGRLRESITYLERARELDPLDLSTSVQLLRRYFMLENWESFEAEYRRSQDLEGDREVIESLQLMRLIVTHADKAAIDAQFKHEFHLPDSSPTLQVLAPTYASPEKALIALRELHETEPDGMNTRLAVFAGFYGDKHLAMEEMRNVVDFKHASIFLHFWYPQLSEARKDPRFKAMMREVGLAQFWRESGKWPDLCGPDGPDDFKCW